MSTIKLSYWQQIKRRDKQSRPAGKGDRMEVNIHSFRQVPKYEFGDK